jgi:hypothetical protein
MAQGADIGGGVSGHMGESCGLGYCGIEIVYICIVYIYYIILSIMHIIVNN